MYRYTLFSAFRTTVYCRNIFLVSRIQRSRKITRCFGFSGIIEADDCQQYWALLALSGFSAASNFFSHKIVILYLVAHTKRMNWLTFGYISGDFEASVEDGSTDCSSTVRQFSEVE